ncbi:hypothetical protein GCM10025883_19230 [Mobilicoccus caccae]|uniref:Integral membrane bound transporter domain-containing protein n=1 Tax=Mobilicoccus caccae TaxID=1859295 RepID=A0ABQ6IPN9_9MICO|nr:hypothetical protein GCM10025883_19230 [Mobilicoccus caccae]
MRYTDELAEAFTRRAAAARRRSRTSVHHRWGRLKARTFFLAQIAISAALAWFIARDVLGHPQPFFAPVAAVVALGLSFGQRLERAIQIVFGVAVGVGVGDLVVAQLGSGYWQLAVIVFTAMAITTFLDGGVLTTTQAGVQSAIVTILVAAPDQAVSRWIDAVVGGAVALAAATITPAAPLRRPRQHTSEIVAEMSRLFGETAEALASEDLDRCERTLERARRTEHSLNTLESLADDGLSVIRSSPFRRRQLPAVQEIADLLEPLDRALRNLRVLVRRGTIAVRQGERVPRSYLQMVRDLAAVSAEMAADLSERRIPEARRLALYQLAEETTYVDPRPTLSSEVIRAQVRSIILDLLMVSGLTFEEALTGIPSSYSLHGEPDEVLGDVDLDDLDDVDRTLESDDDPPPRHEPRGSSTPGEVSDRTTRRNETDRGRGSADV